MMPSALSPTPPSQDYWRDRQWIHDHYADLVNAYPNEWIAVHAGVVLASGRHLTAVEQTARAGCSAPDIVFQFIDDGSLIF
jgi:hypothetical protein